MHEDDITQPQLQDVGEGTESPIPQHSAEDKKRWAEFRQRIDANKAHKKKLVKNWQINIDFRRGKTHNSQSDDDAVAVNLDWSFTKTKHAALFSQVPKIRVAHHPESVAAEPWLNIFERNLNNTLVKAGIESAMYELLPDVINAAGIGAVLVSYESITREKDVPSIDLSILPPEIHKTAMQSGQLFGQPIPMTTVPDKVATRYIVRRISPADLLWPIDFTGSDFDNAPWIGHTNRIPWAEAATKFKLTEEDKERLLTEERNYHDRLTEEIDKEGLEKDNKVGYDEIFYNEFQYDTNAESFSTIHHLVFLHGKTEPVIDEPWKGQQFNPETRQILGAIKKPIRILTLAYLSDEDIPPSDSAVGRSQVIELNRGRTVVNRQRARSAPMVWFDVNRLDPTLQAAIMRGVWQHAIPVQGDGSRIVGTVQQPGIHPDNYKFDEIAKLDLQEIWTIGSNQLGTGSGVETKGEAGIIQNNLQTKIGSERARVASFFVGVGEVVGGLMCLNENPAMFGEGFDPTICEKLGFSILADSTVLVDANQRLERLNNFVNTYAKSGFVAIEPILKEIATLVGLDPSVAVRAPEPKTPPPPNISLRLTGGEDMGNPLLLAFMLKTGQAPDPELIQKAKELIQLSVQMPQQGQPQALPGLPAGPPTNIGEANADAGLLPAITKRAEDGPQGGTTGGAQ